MVRSTKQLSHANVARSMQIENKWSSICAAQTCLKCLNEVHYLAYGVYENSIKGSLVLNRGICFYKRLPGCQSDFFLHSLMWSSLVSVLWRHWTAQLNLDNVYTVGMELHCRIRKLLYSSPKTVTSQPSNSHCLDKPQYNDTNPINFV